MFKKKVYNLTGLDILVHSEVVPQSVGWQLAEALFYQPVSQDTSYALGHYPFRYAGGEPISVLRHNPLRIFELVLWLLGGEGALQAQTG